MDTAFGQTLVEVCFFPLLSEVFQGYLLKVVHCAFSPLNEVYCLLPAQYDCYQCGKICIYSFR